MPSSSVHFSSERGDWSTPSGFFDRLQGEFPFVLDVCATAGNTKCPAYYSPLDDAFSKHWHRALPEGEWAWMNPPYGDPENPCLPNCKKKMCVKRGFHSRKYIPGIEDWVRRAYVEAKKGAHIVCLLPARTDTKWYHDWVHNKAVEVRLVRGRLKFDGHKNSAPFPSLVAIYNAYAMWHGGNVGDPLETRYTSMLANPAPRVYSLAYAMPRRLRIRPKG